MIGTCIFLAMLVALAMKRNLFGSFTYSDIAIPLMFLALAQGETLVGTPNPAHSGFPLLMIMLYCAALLQRNRLFKYGSVLLLNVLLIYTGFGVFMGAVTLGLFVLELYWGVRGVTPGPVALPIIAILIAAASLGSFFVHYIFWPAVDCFVFPYHPIASYARFMALMFWEFVGPRLPRVGTLIGMAILIVAMTAFGVQVRRLLITQRPAPTALVGSVLLGYSLLFTANAAIGRTCLGIEAALTSRYVTLLIPAFLAIYFYLILLSATRARKLALGLFLLLLVPSAFAVRTTARKFADGKRAWCYLQNENIQYCDSSARFKVNPNPEQDRMKEKLDYLKQHRRGGRSW
jgi:hypothetical protein